MTARIRRAVGYVRVSTTEQAEEGHSLAAQEKAIRRWVDQHDMVLSEVYRDEGVSGKSRKRRPGLAQALEHCKKDKGVLVVYSLSRASRSVLDCLHLSEELHASKADLASISESIDTSTAMGKLFFTIMAALAQLERDLVSERTTATLASMRKDNKRISGHAPYGYRIVAHGKLTPIANEQCGIDLMTEMREGGASYRYICKALTDQGFPPKRGKEWGPGTVKRVLERQAKMAE